MSRRDELRLADILEAIAAIRTYLRDGELATPIVFDAVRMRFIEIGEAVKFLAPETLDKEPAIPWRRIGGMRDRLAHSYFDTAIAIIEVTVVDELDDLETVVKRLADDSPGPH